MATLIPSIGTSAFDSTGERRLAERLEAKLDDDYRLWYDVPMGPRNTHPDFVVLHPRRGILVPRQKHWTLSKISRFDKEDVLDCALATFTSSINKAFYKG